MYNFKSILVLYLPRGLSLSLDDNEKLYAVDTHAVTMVAPSPWLIQTNNPSPLITSILLHFSVVA